jgi:hypothetical protein
VQVWTPYTSPSIVVECATATTAHGSPDPDESAYVVATNLTVSSADHFDSSGQTMHSAAAMVTFPSRCWNYFGDYDFWQINLRVSQIVPDGYGGTTKRIFSSFDNAGIACLGREVGAAGNWLGFVGKNCEMTYLGSSDLVPYIVLRINGYSAGLGTAAALAPARAKKSPPPAPNQQPSKGLKLTPIQPLTAAQLEQLKSATKQ